MGLGFLIFRILFFVLSALVFGLGVWWIYAFLQGSTRFGRTVDKLAPKQSTPEFIDKVEEAKDEVRSRLAVSEAAREEMRHEEEELEELFPENREPKK